MEEQPKKAMELPSSTDENSELRGTTKKAMVWSAQKVEGQPKKAMVLPICTGGTSGSRENWGTPKKAMGRSHQLGVG